jgi:hypothetical protein
MLQQAKPLVVIPTYNEAGNLHAIVAEAFTYVLRQLG